MKRFASLCTSSGYRMGRYYFVTENGVRTPFARVNGEWIRCGVRK